MLVVCRCSLRVVCCVLFVVCLSYVGVCGWLFVVCSGLLLFGGCLFVAGCPLSFVDVCALFVVRRLLLFVVW